MNILKINSSGNKVSSVSRAQVENIVSKLSQNNPDSNIVERDVTYSDLSFVDQSFLGAAFEKGELNTEQAEALELSNKLVDEVIASDVLVIGAPMYNFTIPASLKAYFDLISRAGRTFQYGENGIPHGLLENKKAYVVISTGGTPLGSDYDFSTGYIRTFLGFIGITDVEFLDVDEMMFKAEEKLENAKAFVEAI